MNKDSFLNKEEESLGLKEKERQIYTEKVDKSIFELYRLHKMDKLILQPIAGLG